jgi:diguanylate cyclase (GGDEF)-like protein
MENTRQSLAVTAKLLKSKVTNYALYGAIIAAIAVIVGTILSSYFQFEGLSLEGVFEAQKTNSVLWVLDCMPFVFAIWGQYIGTIVGYEAGALVVDQAHEFRDQTATLERQAMYKATHDSLTDLPNRALLFDRLEQAIKNARREEKKVAVLLLDIDRFKEINDTLGHYNGDRILKQISMRLSGITRETDTLARLGGDEFAILLASVVEENAVDNVAKKIKNALITPFMLDELTLDVQASIGAVIFPDHGDDADTMIQHADVAMYAAKKDNSGFVMYSPKLDLSSPHRLTLMGELRKAIEQDDLVLQYQPKINIKTNRVTDVEVLVRWQHKTHGLMPPGEFIGLAERTGLIKQVTRWVLKHALQQGTIWYKSGLDIGIAVNLSTRNLLDPEFPDVVAGLLASCEFPPRYLILEITETTTMADPERALEILERITQMGVRISIDDFGTGYSSLSYLKKLPANEIKIDKSFVMEMLKNENDAVIVKATIELGHSLGFEVVAEGVEDEETLLKLKSLGCDLIQGFYISRPIGARDFTAWYKSSVWEPKEASVG